jgi:5-methylcytosine-specific restriction endonuclease McrA
MSTTPTCTYCGIILVTTYDRTRVAPPNLLTKDHLTPTSRGGSKGASNWVVSCYQCNQDKGPLTEEEFREVMHDRQLLKARIREMHSVLNVRRFAVDGLVTPIKCYYCKTQLKTYIITDGMRTPGDALTSSRRVPRVRGGQNTVNNYVQACHKCSTTKSCLTETEYLAVRHDSKLLKQMIRQVNRRTQKS